MQVEGLVVLVEEPSMEAALEQLLPKMIRADVRIDIRQFQCKHELLTQLPQRLRGYASWLPTSSRILVIVDRDNDDCTKLKRRLEAVANAAGLSTKTKQLEGRVHVINRIAIEELEAWFFGDWPAVCKAYSRMDEKSVLKSPFRIPDEIAGGTCEALERELQRRGYFSAGLRKIEFARAVATHMNPATNRSQSFCRLRDAISAL